MNHRCIEVTCSIKATALTEFDIILRSLNKPRTDQLVARAKRRVHKNFCPPIQIMFSYRAFSAVTTAPFPFLKSDNYSTGLYLQSPDSKR